MGLGGFVLGSPILYLKGMRILMFQLSGFYYMNPSIWYVNLTSFLGVLFVLKVLTAPTAMQGSGYRGLRATAIQPQPVQL